MSTGATGMSEEEQALFEELEAENRGDKGKGEEADGGEAEAEASEPAREPSRRSEPARESSGPPPLRQRQAAAPPPLRTEPRRNEPEAG